MASADLPGSPTAHTTTEQWQSFEMRMRQRRIDRLLLRAQIAHEAGRDAEAREALDEAAELNGRPTRLTDLPPAPADPIADVAEPAGTITILEEIEDAQPVPDLGEIALDRVAVQSRRTHSLFPRIAAVLTVLSVLAFTGKGVSDEPAMNVAAPASTNATAPKTPSDSERVQVAITEVATGNAVSEPVAAPKDVQEVALAGRQTEIPESTAAPFTPRNDRTALPAVAEADLSPSAAPPPPIVPVGGSTLLEAAPLSPAPVAPPIPSAPPPPTPRVVPATEVTTDAAAPAAREAASDESAIRRALAKYESAYSGLDAGAAAAVFPGLDRGALARAFEGLASQSVRLGSCDVRIMAEIAVADCAGSATWTPKVGGGSRTQQRRWQFRLRNLAGTWQIVGATVR